ncbi:unnamed protein product [Anisakis simplex]|uniref:Uncharacterized protein n=1 Tax=Anisakis simplex TaxID=6269 RepID=A0A0M3J534_ANISI|nr:unnamed protein product [Anisakis simplex]
MLSTLDRLAFEERLNADGGKDVYENIVHNARDVLRKGMDSALLWQSRPQQCHEIGHSKATFTLAKFVGASSEEISSITERLNNQRVIDNKWSVEDEHLEDAQPKTSGIKGVPSLKKQSPHQVMNTKTNKMKRKRPEAPPVLRIDSASFGSFFKKPTKLSADSFVNRLDEASSYSIRQKQMLSVIDKLRDLIRM